MITIYEVFFRKKKPIQNPELSSEEIDIVKDVNKFNEWLTDKYGGIVGRIDKLSPGLISKYFKDSLGQEVDLEIQIDFKEQIRKQWLEDRSKY